MPETTMEDRSRELRALLDAMEAHPDKDWSQQRQRVAVLQSQLAAAENARKS